MLAEKQEQLEVKYVSLPNSDMLPRNLSVPKVAPSDEDMVSSLGITIVDKW